MCALAEAPAKFLFHLKKNKLKNRTKAKQSALVGGWTRIIIKVLSSSCMPWWMYERMIWATANGYLVLQQVFYLAVRWQIFKQGVHIQFAWSRWLQRHAAHFLSHSWCKTQIKGLVVISLACACRSGLVMCPRMCRYYLSSPALCALLAPLHSRCLLFCFQVTSLQARLDFACWEGRRCIPHLVLRQGKI